MTNIFLVAAIVLLILWALYSTYYLFSYKGEKNPYLVRSIPSIFTTIGILGTFLGIAVGLMSFDTETLNKSIPQLLNGLRTAFISSILGIFLALIFGRLVEYKVYQAEQLEKEKEQEEEEKVLEVHSPDELAALNKIIALLTKQDKNTNLLEEIHAQLESKFAKQLSINQDALHTKIDTVNLLLDDLNQVTNEIHTQRKEDSQMMRQSVNAFYKSINSIEETIKTNDLKLKERTNRILTLMTQNHAALTKQLDGFSKDLKKNNTEALVEVMKKVTEEFSQQMNKIISALVQENFDQLNDSVQKLNEWQQQNHQQMKQLVQDYQIVSANFKETAKMTEQVAKHTHQLVSDESHLAQMIKELQTVLIEDKKFSTIVGQMETTANNIGNTSKDINEISTKLETFVHQHYHLVDNTQLLLNQIQEFKNTESLLWTNIRKSLNDSVHEIDKTIKRRDDEYMEWLEKTLSNLDLVMTRFMEGKR